MNEWPCAQGRERVISKSHDGFKEHFVEIDANKDGKIDKDVHMPTVNICRLIEVVDRNGWGRQRLWTPSLTRITMVMGR